MQEAVDIIAKLNLNEYDIAFGELQQNALAEQTRGQAIEELIALDRDYINQMTTLTALRGAYRQLPEAHNELAKAVNDEGQGLSTIINVLETGKRLQAGYDQALTANKAAAVQAEADKASAQAAALEAQAESAALEAAMAKLAAEQARIDAAANPDDEEKQNLARDLDAAATAAEEEAATKAANAQELRAAAEAVQERADDIKRRLTESS